MSESTESTTERNPFTKPGFIISAALVVALIAAAVVIFFLPKDRQHRPARPGLIGEPRRLRDSQHSQLRRGWKECLRAALKHGDGPGNSTEVQVGTRRENGRTHRPQDLRPGRDGRRRVPSCFAHSPTGASTRPSTCRPLVRPLRRTSSSSPKSFWSPALAVTRP